jgi:integrase
LSEFAVKHFEALAELSEHDAWIFPDTSGRKPVCVKSFGKQLSDRQRTANRRMANRTAKTDSLVLAGGRWTAHDLRRTAATLMAHLGIATDVIHECLNHKQADRMSLVYIQNRRETEQAIAFDALGKRLDSLVSGAADTNIIPMRRSARGHHDGTMSA